MFDKFLEITDVCRLTNKRYVIIKALEKSGYFPRQTDFGYRKSEIKKWLKQNQRGKL
jgi:predicted DNA-binding transcriptional regulator AlpA